MNDFVTYVAVLTLVTVVAVVITSFISVAVFIYCSIKMNKEFDAVTQRIKKRRELNGRATDHKIDLSKFKGGGWTGEFDSKKPIDLGLNKPHPFYSKEADDEANT